MFRNVGKQIKGITIFLAVIEILAAVAFAGYIVYMGIEQEAEDMAKVALIAIGVVLGGVLIAWLSNLMLYSYGQLVDSNERIARNTEILVKRSRNSDY
ncbi:MAG: hypothetical protein IKJ65_12835 [Clostridia bacterium]|nr:hypothetical protein [Clostridia bacterium]